MSNQIEQKIINNAVSAYFWLGPLLLLNKTDSSINNTFVRGHSKTATLLMLFGIAMFLFLKFFSFLGQYSIFGYDLFYILKTIFVLWVFTAFVYGAFRAFNGRVFTITEIPDLTHTRNLVQISKSKVTKEQDKTSIIMSYIPFFGYFLYPQLKKYPSIQSVNKINLYSTIAILFFYTTGKAGLATLLFLLYIIYVVYTAMTLYAKWEIKIPKLEKLWSFEELYIRAKAFCQYIYNYTSRDKRFREYELYYKIEKAAQAKQAKLILKDLLPRKSLPFPKAILYIPFINIVWVFFLDTRYRTHIINGLCINVLLISIWVLTGFNSAYSLFILFPISYGLAYRRKIDYRFPLIYDIAKIEMTAWKKAKELTNEVREISKEKTETLFTPQKQAKEIPKQEAPELTKQTEKAEVNIEDIKNIK